MYASNFLLPMKKSSKAIALLLITICVWSCDGNRACHQYAEYNPEDRYDYILTLPTDYACSGCVELCKSFIYENARAKNLLVVLVSTSARSQSIMKRTAFDDIDLVHEASSINFDVELNLNFPTLISLRTDECESVVLNAESISIRLDELKSSLTFP